MIVSRDVIRDAWFWTPRKQPAKERLHQQMQPEVYNSKLALSSNAVPITAFIVLLAGLGLSCGNIASSGSDSSIHVEANQTSFSVPREFMGFSLEWGEAKPMMGTPATGT